MSENSILQSAHIPSDAQIGQYCVMENDVRIGKRCTIENHVVIYPNTVIGDEVSIQNHAVVGKPPIRGKRSVQRLSPDSDNPARIESGVRISAHAIIYNLTSIADSVLTADSAAGCTRASFDWQRDDFERSVTIENDTVIRQRTKLETACYITAYSELGNNCFIAPMAASSNDAFLGRTEERFGKYRGKLLSKTAEGSVLELLYFPVL